MNMTKLTLVFLFTAASFALGEVPSSPRGLAMVANSPDSVTLSWYGPGEGKTVLSYTLYASKTRDGAYEEIARTAAPDRSATDAKLPPGTTRFYRVSATNTQGQSAMSDTAPGFTFEPCLPTPFPVQVAKNMCLSMGSTIVSTQTPLSGKLEYLCDGSDATGARLRRDSEVRIKLTETKFTDADYLLINFRTDCGPTEWSKDRFARTLKKYVVLESLDSTTGEDGTWQEVITGSNDQLDGIIVIPNHQPKWIAVRSLPASEEKQPSTTDVRPHSSDLILARLEVFRSAPSGQRNDYWIFTGDSLVVQDMPAGTDPQRQSHFSDLARKQHPDRYPIVVHAGRGGEMLKDTLARMHSLMPSLSPPNGTKTPTGTIVCWESGFNDVGVGGSLSLGAQLIKSYASAQQLCEKNGLVMVPVRLEFATTYLDLATLQPNDQQVFFNTLAVSLGGVDVFCRTQTPYACDPATQLPYADYWTFTRNNYTTALVKDGVHHTKSGQDGINRLWSEVAHKMVYSP